MNVSTREFQLNQKEYLDKLKDGEPLVLTNRNIPVAVVFDHDSWVELEKHEDRLKEKSVPVNEQQVRLIVKMVMEELGTMVPENKPRETGTMPVENTATIPSLTHGTSTSSTPKETVTVMGTIPIENTTPNTPVWVIGRDTHKPEVVIEPEALWEDYNLMPVYKTGVPDQFCVTWHSKGERRIVYPIRKFRPDGSLEFEGKYCKECIKEFLAKDGHLE